MNETAVKVPPWWFIHPSAWNRYSAKFTCRILDKTT
jgi:hypothetical protein